MPFWMNYAFNFILDELRFQFLKSQQRMKKWADMKRKEVSFEVGDWVFLKLQPYRQMPMARRPVDKLAARFYGPYLVEAKVGNMAYRLQLPSTSKIHLVFHVSQLKRAHGSTSIPMDIPHQLTDTLELDTEPAELLGVRNNPSTQDILTEVLIRRSGLHASEATWEQFHNIALHFSQFHLEDKVCLIGAGIVMKGELPQIKHVYSRRAKKGKEGKEGNPS